MQVITIFVQLLYQKTLMLILYLPQLFIQSDFNVTITPQNMQVIIRKTGERIIALANYADVSSASPSPRDKTLFISL